MLWPTLCNSSMFTCVEDKKGRSKPYIYIYTVYFTHSIYTVYIFIFLCQKYRLYTVYMLLGNPYDDMRTGRSVGCKKREEGDASVPLPKHTHTHIHAHKTRTHTHNLSLSLTLSLSLSLSHTHTHTHTHTHNTHTTYTHTTHTPNTHTHTTHTHQTHTDGAFIMAGGEDGRCVVWDSVGGCDPTPLPHASLGGHTAPIHTVVWNPRLHMAAVCGHGSWTPCVLVSVCVSVCVCVCVCAWLAGWVGVVVWRSWLHMAAVCGHGSWTPCVLVCVCALLAGWVGVGVWRSWLLCAAMGRGRHAYWCLFVRCWLAGLEWECGAHGCCVRPWVLDAMSNNVCVCVCVCVCLCEWGGRSFWWN